VVSLGQTFRIRTRYFDLLTCLQLLTITAGVVLRGLNLYFHHEAMSVMEGSVRLSQGIQDIAAILPLLGTEQCSVQSQLGAYTRLTLRSSSTHVHLGSLGVVNAGFKTLVAYFSFGDIEGAKILSNLGLFEPQGENLSLIMVEAVREEHRALHYRNSNQH
jgi:hypothetical protein